MSGNRLTEEEFLIRYNNKFNKEYNNSLPQDFCGQSQVIVTCDLHVTYTESANELLGRKSPCRECGIRNRHLSNKRNGDNKKIPFSAHVTEFRKIHNDLYYYPEQEFKNSHSKITIICKKHSEFRLHIHSHLKGVGCPHCRKENLNLIRESKRIKREEEIEQGKKNRINANKKRTQSREEIEIRFRGAHGDKFEYNWDIYTNPAGKIVVICPRHGSSIQIVKEHINAKYGCPYCARTRNDSEISWLKRFKITDTQFRIDLNKGFIKVDGYDRITNTIYEYLGDYWHGNPISTSRRHNSINQNNKIPFTELFRFTEDRFQLLKSMNYNIVYIWENDLKLSTTGERVFNTILEF